MIADEFRDIRERIAEIKAEEGTPDTSGFEIAVFEVPYQPPSPKLIAFIDIVDASRESLMIVTGLTDNLLRDDRMIKVGIEKDKRTLRRSIRNAHAKYKSIIDQAMARAELWETSYYKWPQHLLPLEEEIRHLERMLLELEATEVRDGLCIMRPLRPGEAREILNRVHEDRDGDPEPGERPSA